MDEFSLKYVLCKHHLQFFQNLRIHAPIKCDFILLNSYEYT